VMRHKHVLSFSLFASRPASFVVSIRAVCSIHFHPPPNFMITF
jgi:hypothetical protein